MSKAERLGHANALIKVISSHGRRFFYNAEAGTTGSLELDARGRVWWIDDYRGARIYTAYQGRWRGFSHGGTMRDLICALREYIQRGELLHPEYIAPAMSYGDMWGYGAEAAKAIRAEAHKLPMFAAAQQTQGGEHV
ncbi:hypothetical protein QYQ99_17590 [Comamonas testosteroni]|uniref:hypothetical protein n=1 Tax=Comamonas testosteroni TaxID=285 RepID=UPI00265E0F5D|nr:hypothetical protein [Comamonas testosteroni]WKL14220.1 hypothetical protein QYQ99_17590 [Comamonas testosteroni]